MSDADRDESYAVPYYPLRCPHCKSKRVKGASSPPERWPVRYHKCLDCGEPFKSIEKDPPSLQAV